MTPRRLTGALAAAALTVTALGACAAPAESSADTVKVGVLTSTSGLLSSYGRQYSDGFAAGLDYATDGTGKVGDITVEVTYHDDAGEPEKATSTATGIIGDGYTILAGTASSGVATQLAPLAEQNQILYIGGPAATDAMTGINDFTFRSGRQTYQDLLAAQSFLGDLEGKKILVLAQDYAFGQDNVAAAEKVFGEEGGADVEPVLVPLDTTDFTPFARQITDAKPDMLFVAWAGDTASNMWQTLDQQKVFDSTKVVTGLAERVGYETFGAAGTKIDFLSHYFAEATDNEPATALAAALAKDDITPDIFHTDGFTAAQMVVRAIAEGGTDPAAMAKALEGWTFTSPKGESTVRASDHALLQPMFQARLVEKDGALVPELVTALTSDDVTPPEAK
ncbi:substrate-binding domain-containing protein [Stackebrandtia soli]|uniref:substrate-binding domain-containing protein n=1 Tax=Stackebrandtia soli TaxID=1892856 RepID=UPI0039ECB50E